MKKIIIAMAAIAAAFTMASCNKEQPVSPIENPTVGKSVITASIENDLTKAYLDANGNDTDGYKVYWSEGDNLFVDDYWEEDWFAEFTLENSSAGSSRGIFKWNKDENYFYQVKRKDGTKYYEPIFEIDKTYEAIFPFSFFYFNDDGFVEGNTWKTEQTYADMYIPMYGKAKCTEEGKADFVFTNLGGLLRLTVKGTATISSITIQATEQMSGEAGLIEDAEGNIVAEIVGGYPLMKNEVTLDCGNNGVALTDAGTDFCISLPCYMNSKKENIGYSNVTITLTDTEGRTCEKKLNNKNLVIERSKITTATFTASEFKANVPEGALPGKFTINEAGDQVYFSQGNLYWDGSAFKFEDSQTGFASEWNAEHVSHFFWSKDADVAVSETYSDPDAQDDDVFFTNETEDTAKADFTVNGVSGQYRTLSHEEWKYLIKERTVNGSKGEDKSYSHAVYGDLYGLILYPDDYNGPVISGNITTVPTGCVFLPAAGYRVKEDGHTSQIDAVGVAGCYESSSYSAEYHVAYMLLFSGMDGEFSVNPDACDTREFTPLSVRLVTDCD